MKRKLSAAATEEGEIAITKKAWRTPRVAAIEAFAAEFGADANPDGPYPPS